MKYRSPLALVLIFLALFGCSEDQQELGLQAERTYVDLLYALQSEDRAASLTAVSVFNNRVKELRKVWYRPMPTDGLDNMRYHVDLAECAYEDARVSIEGGQLNQALVQLDRAVYELEAGDPSALKELYIGSIYDFVAGWLEIDFIFRGGTDGMELQLLDNCNGDARRAWRSAKKVRPSQSLYFDRLVDRESFNTAHATLDQKLQAFNAAVHAEDVKTAGRLSNEVSEALWELLLLFGTPSVNLADL